MTEFNLEVSETKNIFDYADLILDYLHAMGVEYVFGVPGGEIEPLFNALARSDRRGKIKAIVARHECGAAFMADGYFRETGKIGVVCSTTGPGATNLITGVASAAIDNSSILVITAQTGLSKFGKKPLQDSSDTATDTVGIFRNFTKFNTLVSHPDQLETKLISALMESIRYPRGPSHISIPSNILSTACVADKSNVNVDFLMKQGFYEDRYATDTLIEEIKKAKKVVLVLGYGCERVYSQIEQLSELLWAPFISGPMGKAWVNDKHPLYRGVYGFAGHSSASELLENNDIDLVIIIGTTITEMGIGALISKTPNDRIIHIDSTVEHFARSPRAKLHVSGHLDLVFERLLTKINTELWEKPEPWCEPEAKQNILGGYATLINPEKCIADSSPIKPQRLMADLSQSLPSSTRIFVDTGNSWAWATHYFNKTSNAGLYRMSMTFGSMAWAIGAVIGSSCAKPKAPHVCLTGDGAWLMSAQEIGVAVKNKLPILFVVLNDSAYGMVRFGQKIKRAESIGWQLNEVDFAMLARAQGADGHIIETSRQLADIDFDSVFSKSVPTLLDVRIDSNEIPPMMSRIENLKNSGLSIDEYK